MPSHRREFLAGHAVVWLARVSQSQGSLGFLEPCLDDRDRARAARFHFPEDRARFVLGRGLLRKCLASFLGQAPETIELDYTPLSRPVLKHIEAIQFSISHAQDIVALAVTNGARIGIDVEAVQAHADLADLAARIFSDNDLTHFESLPANEQLPAFHRVWTRKEAYLKARGEGIAERLQQISVSMGPEEIITLLDKRNVSPAEKWRLLALPVPEGYAGTLACDDGQRPVEGSYVTFVEGEPIPNISSNFTLSPS